jgi:hypothetical protein
MSTNVAVSQWLPVCAESNERKSALFKNMNRSPLRFVDLDEKIIFVLQKSSKEVLRKRILELKMHHVIKFYILFTILPYGDYPPSRYMFLQTYYQSLAIGNTIYVHTIYVSYTVCVSWIIKSSDVRFTNLKL